MARLVRPMWEQKVLVPQQGSAGGFMRCPFTAEQLEVRFLAASLLSLKGCESEPASGGRMIPGGGDGVGRGKQGSRARGLLSSRIWKRSSGRCRGT